MPPPLRNVAASIKGYQLRSWRYGLETEKLVKEALERDSWTSEQWKVYQEERLAYILDRAAKHVPYYRDQWVERRKRGDKSSWDYLENWPVLSKDTLRNKSRSFIADDCNIKYMYHEHTSGTTGKPLDLWWSPQMVREWYALFEARLRRWYGVSRDMRWAILGGQLITPVRQQNPPFWVWNHALNQLYLSSYHLSPNNVSHYLRAIADYGIEYLHCYTSAAYALASAVEISGLKAPQLKVVVTNAEPVEDYQRDVIHRVFMCPVRETYGMAEAVAAASECEYHKLHIWPEVGMVELKPNSIQNFKSDESELLCTGLLNKDMPLIRYLVGDSGSLDNYAQCSCGRTLPCFNKIYGRSDDILFTRDGRAIGRLDPIFKADLPIVEAQIVQESLEHIRVIYVPSSGFTKDTESLIGKRLRDRVGDVFIEFSHVDTIPRQSMVSSVL